MKSLEKLELCLAFYCSLSPQNMAWHMIGPHGNIPSFVGLLPSPYLLWCIP